MHPYDTLDYSPLPADGAGARAPSQSDKHGGLGMVSVGESRTFAHNTQRHKTSGDGSASSTKMQIGLLVIAIAAARYLDLTESEDPFSTGIDAV